MLYDFLIVLLTVYIMVLPFLLFYVVSVLLNSKESVPKLVRRKHPKPKMSEKDQRIIDILANIDNYDGTSKGQKPVKE